MLKNEFLPKELERLIHTIIMKHNDIKIHHAIIKNDINVLEFGKKYYLYCSKENTIKACYLKNIILKNSFVDVSYSINILQSADNKQYAIELNSDTKIFDSLDRYYKWLNTHTYIREFNTIKLSDIFKSKFPNNFIVNQGLDYTKDVLHHNDNVNIFGYCWINGEACKKDILFDTIWINEDESIHYDLSYNNIYYNTKNECIKENMPKVIDFEEEIIKPKNFKINVNINVMAKTKEEAIEKINTVIESIKIK